MDIRKENKGFTLMELIIAIAILGILSGVFIQAVSYIQYGNVKKCVGQIDSALDKIQLEAMSKEKTPYLYIYNNEKGYFMVISTRKNLSYSELSAAGGTKLANSSISVKVSGKRVVEVDGTVTELAGQRELSGTEYLRLGFKKSTGAFLEDSFCTAVKVEGRGENTLYLVEGTGKHYVE